MMMNLARSPRLSLTLLALTSALSACGDARTEPRGEVDLIARPSSAAEVRAPGLNFTKTDRTGEAELLGELSFGQASQLESPLAQVIPIPLQSGDRASISVWSDQPSALMLYSPSGVADQWQTEEARLLSEAQKEGLEVLTLTLSAAQSGRYALVIVPTAGATQHLITAQCTGGPCLDQQSSEAQRAVSEEQEATARPVELP